MNRKNRNFHVGTIVRHFKGNLYRIEDFCRNATNGSNEKLMVKYRQLYPPFHSFVRDESEFCSEVDHKKYPDVKQKYRMESVTKEQAEKIFNQGMARRAAESAKSEEKTDAFRIGLYKAKTTKKENPRNAFSEIWVYGNLVHSRGKCYIHPVSNSFFTDGPIVRTIIMHEVQPDTVVPYNPEEDEKVSAEIREEVLRHIRTIQLKEKR